jgi:hypothetical protein
MARAGGARFGLGPTGSEVARGGRGLSVAPAGSPHHSPFEIQRLCRSSDLAYPHAEAVPKLGQPSLLGGNGWLSVVGCLESIDRSINSTWPPRAGSKSHCLCPDSFSVCQDRSINRTDPHSSFDGRRKGRRDCAAVRQQQEQHLQRQEAPTHSTELIQHVHLDRRAWSVVPYASSCCFLTPRPAAEVVGSSTPILPTPANSSNKQQQLQPALSCPCHKDTAAPSRFRRRHRQSRRELSNWLDKPTCYVRYGRSWGFPGAVHLCHDPPRTKILTLRAQSALR